MFRTWDQGVIVNNPDFPINRYCAIRPCWTDTVPAAVDFTDEEVVAIFGADALDRIRAAEVVQHRMRDAR
jgi:hypothetical protein